MARAAALAWLLCAAASAGAAPPSLSPLPAAELERRVDAYVAPYVRMRDFSGVVAVARHDAVLVERAYGAGSYELGTAATPLLRYGIGSVSKTFTAAAVELLAERGLLGLGDRVSKLLPALPWGDRVTVTQLLEHSAGVPDYYGMPEYAARRGAPISAADFVKLIGGKPLDFAPGTQSRYSNSGYLVLAAIIERVSGMSYAEFVRANILSPLHLGASGDLADEPFVAALAPGYEGGFPPSRVQPARGSDPSWLVGNGSLYATAGDLLRWMRAQRDDELVHASKLPYPYGWGKHERFGRAVIEQDGRVPLGYAADIAFYPSDDVMVVVLSNIESQVVERIGADVAAIALGQKAAPPTLRAGAVTPPPAPDAAALGRLTGRYEVFPGFVLTVRAARRGLELAGPDGVFLPLDDEGGGRFFFRSLYVPIGFRVDRAGRATALVWAGETECKRLS